MSEPTCLWCKAPMMRQATRIAQCPNPTCAMHGRDVAVPPSPSDRWRELASDLGAIIDDLDPTGAMRGMFGSHRTWSRNGDEPILCRTRKRAVRKAENEEYYLRDTTWTPREPQDADA